MIGLGNALIVLAVWSAMGGSPFDNIERITPEVAAERAKQCGLGQVTLRYESELQSHILTVANAASANEGQLDCLDKAAGWGVFVELPPNVQPRFNAIREERASVMMKGVAREWLSQRGLLDREPKYVPGTTDEGAFTRDVEQLCGPGAHGAFQSRYGHHAISPDWVQKMAMPPKPEDLEVFSCLSHVTTVAGFKVVLIGNEAPAR